MPRTALTVQAAAGGYETALTALTWTAADVANKNSFKLTGAELILARNVHATLAYTVTLTSVAGSDVFKRSGTITAESLAAGVFRMYGPVPVTGWIQADGNMYLEASDASIQFAIIKLPHY